MQDVALHLHKEDVSKVFAHLADSIKQDENSSFGSDVYSANLSLKYCQKLNTRHPGLVDVRLVTLVSAICNGSDKKK